MKITVYKLIGVNTQHDSMYYKYVLVDKFRQSILFFDSVQDILLCSVSYSSYCSNLYCYNILGYFDQDLLSDNCIQEIRDKMVSIVPEEFI